MRLLSVNVGQPCANPWKPVKLTGIDKRPVGGPVLVTAPGPKGTGAVGLAGDRVYDVKHHGGPDQAVYAYAREDLDGWEAELGRPLSNGAFGENLTTEGIDVSGALIGERWRVGPQVILEVCCPRIPCGTFQGWLGRTGWIKRFTQAARPGAYLRVIRPGPVRAGDPVVIEHRPEHDVTIATTFRALTTEPDLLQSLSAAAALPDDIRELAGKRAPGSLRSNAVSPEQIAAAVELRQALAGAGGLGAVDRFVAQRRGLSRGARDLVLDWADNNVRGVFELLGRGARGGRAGGSGAVAALNLIDDLEYRVYGLDPVTAGGGFFAGTLLPLTPDDSAWLAGGDEAGYPRTDARQVAGLAIDRATREPDLVFRNPEKVRQGWEHMRRDREEFLAFFGSDELVLPTLEAQGRLNAYYKRRRDSALAARGRHRAVNEAGETTFVMPEGFFEFDTVGIIYDELDGFVVVPEYGMLRALFADPSLAADREHANVLRAYLREDTIPPLPLRRLAAAYPGSVDPVFRRVLGNRNFSWIANGPGLLRKRKPGYYESDPTPGVAVLSDRLMALTRGAAS